MRNMHQEALVTLTEPSDEQPIQLIVNLSAIPRWQRTKIALTGFLLAVSKGLGDFIRMTQPTRINEFLSYVPKRDKVTEGVLLLLKKTQEGGRAMSATQLATVMFLADKAHLDVYGRPVFFDNYVATKNGPEGVAAMEMLDCSYDWTSDATENAPWTTENFDGQSCVRALRSPNMRRLSETDVEALDSALGMVTNLNTDQLGLFTHRGQAYAAAWADGKGDGSRLDPRLIPDNRDDEMIDDLLYASRHAYVAPAR